MAKNLRAKIAPSDTLVVHDVKTTATTRFIDELADKNNSSIASDVRTVAEQSVSRSRLITVSLHVEMTSILPMI